MESLRVNGRIKCTVVCQWEGKEEVNCVYNMTCSQLSVLYEQCQPSSMPSILRIHNTESMLHMEVENAQD